MTAPRYAKLYGWFAAHPIARRAVILADRVLPALPFVCYPALLLLLCARAAGLIGVAPLPWPQLARAVLVPAAVFLGGTLLRKILNRPRPYEQPGFVPLVQKETRGKSFPSRHALSASVLAVVWLYFTPPVGVFMTVLALAICVLRVLTGVHHEKDVLAGALLGFVCGFVGMFVI